MVKLNKDDEIYIQSLTYAIARLIVARRNAQGNELKQIEISKKLEKLYDIKYLAIQQAVAKVQSHELCD